jgi:hypothetical protein
MTGLSVIMAARKAKWRRFRKRNNGGQLTWPGFFAADVEAREQDIDEPKTAKSVFPPTISPSRPVTKPHTQPKKDKH